METADLQRIDSYPYRHRLADVMARSVVTLPENAPLRRAVAEMHAQAIGSVVIVDGQGKPIGILTERDIMGALIKGAAALEAPIGRSMSQPVVAMPADAYLYRAIAAMERRNIRHIVALDHDGRAVGMVSARNLLRQRASAALRLGDQIDIAPDAQALAEVQQDMPALAQALLAEGVAATDIAAVISAASRDMGARAATLAIEWMRAQGRGAAPAPWCLLILGSGGRGESLLAPDQDNALIHAGSDGDDAWFGAFAGRFNAILDGAGIPLCKGGVMAKNPAWRHSVTKWTAQVADWIARPEGEALLNVDIFYDCRPIAGDAALALALRHQALALAQVSPTFLRLLAANAENLRAPLGLWGGIKTDRGRVDLKKGALLPIITAARVIALKLGIDAVSSDERLRLAAQRLPGSENLLELIDARGVIVAALLSQQLIDIAAGVAPGNRVDPATLDRHHRRALKQALREAAGAETLIADALTA